MLIKKIFYIVLIGLVFSQIMEKMIPHSHDLKGDIITVDFSPPIHESSEDHNAAELLHSEFYQPVSHIIIPILRHHFVPVGNLENNLIIEEFFLDHYNLLPKILQSHLLVVHLCSSKSPPLYFEQGLS